MALTAHQKKFKKASELARKKCHKETSTPGTYGKCFGASMKKSLTGKGKKKAKKASSKSNCAGIVKSGAKKGKLKKGYRFAKGKRCPVKA